MLAISLLRALLPSPRALRLSAYFTCVFLLLAGLGARALSARMKEAVVALGHELSGLSDLTGGAEVLLVNGERLQHAVAATSSSVGEVLDRIEAHCAENPGLLARVLAENTSRHPELLARYAPPGALARAVIRESSDERGFVVCFTDGPGSSPGGLLGAIEGFIQTSKLSAFGRVVYTFAEQEQGQTRVVTLWADTDLNLGTMFPAAGDAAGADSTVLPRPPHARRTLSAAAHKMPFALRIYESSTSRAFQRNFYETWMKERGWKRLGSSEPAGTTSYLRADGYQAFLSLSERADRTYVTLTEAGRAQASSIAEVQISE